jgi:Flp pilus assembly protein TadB
MNLSATGPLFLTERLHLGHLKIRIHAWKDNLKKASERKRSGETRNYPPFWERAVPVLVALIMILIVGLLVVAVLVALGIFP